MYDNTRDYEYARAELEARRKRRLAQRKRQKRRRRLLLLLLTAAVLTAGAIWLRHLSRAESEPPPAPPVSAPPTAPPVTPPPFTVRRTQQAAAPGDDLASAYAILLDADTGEVLAEKDAQAVISPASMTKILTVLVAAEQVKDLDDTVPITVEITDMAYESDCSAVGYVPGDTPTVRELFYGTILPSGADAALALANYAAGSQEAFMVLMNQKLTELGLDATAHFTNCIGLYDEAHRCTAQDMAVILRAAMANDLCRQVLSTKIYTTASTQECPDGIELSNWFLRRIEDKDTGGVTVVGAKTGFVEQAGSCAASYGEDGDGHHWLCVTGNAGSAWQAIYDHVALYSTYCS